MYCAPVQHTENRARGARLGGQSESFKNVGKQRCIRYINSSKVKGAELT